MTRAGRQATPARVEPPARPDVAPPPWNPERNPPAMSRTPLIRPAPEIDYPADAYVIEIPYAPEARIGRRRRRLLTALAYLLLAAAVLFLGRYVHAEGSDRIVVPQGPPSVAARTGGISAISVPPPVPRAGTSGRFSYVPGYGPVLGGAGPIRRFRVAVEKPVGTAAAKSFADEVNRTLGDRRSWIAGRAFRLQRVPISAYAEFTIFLASARTSQRMCRAGGLETAAYTSCRLPRQVIVNDDRWEGAVRGYGAPLATYRDYVINHEVGHQLGHGHEACPGKGRPAPVMMQQTYGLRGCVAYPWPYLDGRRYAGRPAR
jgi:hypothetical protein